MSIQSISIDITNLLERWFGLQCRLPRPWATLAIRAIPAPLLAHVQSKRPRRPVSKRQSISSKWHHARNCGSSVHR